MARLDVSMRFVAAGVLLLFFATTGFSLESGWILTLSAVAESKLALSMFSNKISY